MTRAPAAAAIGTGLVLAAAAFGVPAMYVPGVALLCLAAVAGLAVARPSRALRLGRSPAVATTEEGQALGVTLRVRRGMLPPAGGWLVAPGEVTRVALRQALREEVEVAVPTGRRGRRRLIPGPVVIGDPLGMTQRRLPFPDVEVLVLPRVEPVVADPAGGAGGRGRWAAARPRTPLRSRSTACGRTESELRPRAFTGEPSRAPAPWSSVV